MNPHRLTELEAQLAAGTITDADLLVLLTQGYGHSLAAAQAALQASAGTYTDSDGAVTYVHHGQHQPPLSNA